MRRGEEFLDDRKVIERAQRAVGASRCRGRPVRWRRDPRVVRSSRLASLPTDGFICKHARRKMDVCEHRRKDWEDFSVTREELKSITDCLKKEEFRKLLIEYAEEVADPDNRRTYEREITQLEKERGVDVTFVNPEPGYVIKTSVDGDRKCFLNISKNDVVARPTSQPSCEQGHRGLQWSIPYTLVPPRYDLDKKNARCMVFDVVFHPDTIYLASKNARFREIVNDTAMDGVESNFKVCPRPRLTVSTFVKPLLIRATLC